MIRTVLGDVEDEALGTTNYHEHLFQVSPLLPGDELDDERSSSEEAGHLVRSGFEAMIDATPIGLGRDPAAVARISSERGLTVVASTGLHRQEHYPEGHWVRELNVAQRAELFLRDLVDGMPAKDGAGARMPAAAAPDGSPVRAGLIKTGIGYWSISPFERATLDAAAVAHAEAGASIMVHLEFCTAAHEVLDHLESAGVAADRVVLAHADRDPDPVLHLELAARGAWLGYDGMARSRTRSDAELVALTEAVVSGGGGGRILIGGDVARRARYVAYGGMPGLAYLGERYLPRLTDRIGARAVERILIDNPRAFLPLR